MYINETETVLFKHNGLAFIRCDKGYVITDSWLTDWVIDYGNGSWAHDGVFYLEQGNRVMSFINEYFKRKIRG